MVNAREKQTEEVPGSLHLKTYLNVLYMDDNTSMSVKMDAGPACHNPSKGISVVELRIS